MTMDDKRSDFENKLDELHRKHDTTLDADLSTLREQFERAVKPALPADISRRVEGFDQRAINSFQAQPTTMTQALVNIQDSGPLKGLDLRFTGLFNLGQYYSTTLLDYPTVFCETLEEFFTPFLIDLDLSTQARQTELKRLVIEAEENAKDQGGGIFGVNFPGRGCYLNGWLFVYGQAISAQVALQDKKILLRVLAVAAHEKLGHGFLSAYSALGAVKNRMGLTTVDLANHFGLHPVDEPTWRLRHDQAMLLFQASQLLEEGWASWIEAYMARQLGGTPLGPRYSMQAVLNAIHGLPETLSDRESLQQLLLGSLELLFNEERSSLPELHQAVMVIEKAGDALDPYFGPILGQPLRYAIGSLLMIQAEVNQGAGCMPYMALIAANLTFDPNQISLSDLRELLGSDPRLNPDARMAALSQVRLKQPNDIKSLAQIAEMELSFSVPKELK
jgi:hypothetical protein